MLLMLQDTGEETISTSVFTVSDDVYPIARHAGTGLSNGYASCNRYICMYVCTL